MTSTSTPPVVTDEHGTVFVEFLVVVVPVWTLALSAFQLSLVSAANLVVKHAADSAARSASVVLADDPAEYGGESNKRIDPSSLALPYAGRSRRQTIELAAQVPLIPFSPVGAGFSLEQAIPSMRAFGPALLRRASQVAVTFAGADPEDASTLEATVRVTYAFECLVPIARRLLCDGPDALQNGQEPPPASFRSFGTLGGSRFRMLTHQTTLLMHDAPYEYRSRGS